MIFSNNWYPKNRLTFWIPENQKKKDEVLPMFYWIFGSRDEAFRDLLSEIFSMMSPSIPAASIARNYLEDGASPRKAVTKFIDVLTGEKNRLQREHQALIEKYSDLNKAFIYEREHERVRRIDVSDAVQRTIDRMEKECAARCAELQSQWDDDKKLLGNKVKEIQVIEELFENERNEYDREIAQLKNEVRQLNRALKQKNREIDAQNQVLSEQHKRIQRIVGPD
jgi:chromosome segregation ATPase